MLLKNLYGEEVVVVSIVTAIRKYFLKRVADWGDFQLITWSKDKTLRFWPIDQDVLQVRPFLFQERSS